MLIHLQVMANYTILQTGARKPVSLNRPSQKPGCVDTARPPDHWIVKVDQLPLVLHLLHVINLVRHKTEYELKYFIIS